MSPRQEALARAGHYVKFVQLSAGALAAMFAVASFVEGAFLNKTDHHNVQPQHRPTDNH
jgi:hypothetical protein